VKSSKRTGLIYGLLLAAVVVVLGIAVTGITWWLRSGLQEQILQREGNSLYAVTIMQRALEGERLADIGLDHEDEQLAMLALQTSRLQGVIDVQVFDSAGEPLPDSIALVRITPPTRLEWDLLRAHKSIVSFGANASMEKMYGIDRNRGAPIPLLEITVPLHRMEETALEGAAHFVIDGKPLAGEFKKLDHRLIQQAGIVWLLASLTVVAGAGWMLARLSRTHAALEARTQDLIRANHELSLAAKTSALGAITAHLVHGLRNPIAGLESYIEEHRNLPTSATSGAWTEATATAGRIKAMINEVVNLMQEEQSGVRYELTGQEVLGVVVDRLAQFAATQKVQLESKSHGEGALTNHQAGLVAAILSNLAQNACEASPADTGKVSLTMKLIDDKGMEFVVADNGQGLPDEARRRLFSPGLSAKSGGAGIGLAISRQLAVHLGGNLELVTTGPAGTSFRLYVPNTSR